MSALRRIDWGRVDYGRALDDMRRLHAARVARRAGDCLIFAEHPPTYTLGEGARGLEVLPCDQELARRGFELYLVEREGGLMYHGPGQQAAYLLAGLGGLAGGLSALAEALESALCQVVASYGLLATGQAGGPGVLVDGRQVGAVGLAEHNGVSLHGVFLNVTGGMEDTGAAGACGNRPEPVSLARLLHRPLDLKVVRAQLHASLARIWAELAIDDNIPPLDAAA